MTHDFERGEALDLKHADRFFIEGEWAVPSSEARLDVTDSASEPAEKVEWKVCFHTSKPRR
jgi:hypothetical protein